MSGRCVTGTSIHPGNVSVLNSPETIIVLPCEYYLYLQRIASDNELRATLKEV